jgi:hypothetical protein
MHPVPHEVQIPRLNRDNFAAPTQITPADIIVNDIVE